MKNLVFKAFALVFALVIVSAAMVIMPNSGSSYASSNLPQNRNSNVMEPKGTMTSSRRSSRHHRKYRRRHHRRSNHGS
jgi:hypothetical protein